jgi:predicted enzyme related to lactoylglutathione lyase
VLQSELRHLCRAGRGLLAAGLWLRLQFASAVTILRGILQSSRESERLSRRTKFAGSGSCVGILFACLHGMHQQPHFGFALEYVKDVEAAKRFYVDVVGLKVERFHPRFVQFHGFAIASDEAMGSGKERELYWLVDDAAEAFVQLSKRSEVTMPVKQMPFGKVFGIKGPAGQPLYVCQLAADRPSQAADDSKRHAS